MGKEITIQVQASQKEIQIVESLAEGYSVREIAEKKNVEPKEIQAVVDRLKNRFSSANTVNLVATFIRNKLID